MIKTKLSQKIMSIFLCISLLISYIPLTAAAAEGYVYKGGAGTKVSDLDTSTKYSESLGDNASTEYAGRIWTDKSVYTDDVTFATYDGGGTSTIKLNENKDGEDFLIAYSALATAESVSGSTQAPVDVVLIIDISGSMSNDESDMDNGKSRIYNTVQATNNAIDELMKLNPYTRVAVVAFSNNAQVLLPLDRYTKGTTTEREWVSTGIRPGQGYWQETEVEAPYFTLSRDTGSDNYATLYTNAINSSNVTIEKSTSVEGGTNIQMGLYEGMQVLAEEDETTANINGETVQRVPSVILLSDGSPTYSSNSTSWWAPDDNNNDGPGSAPYAGNGMKAILVGSYMKDAIDRNYGVADTSFATTVYTIGMGITGLDNTEKNLAYMTLDPGTYWNDDNTTNSMKTTIKDYWNGYTARNNTGTLNINVGKYEDRRYSDKNYALTHPNTGYDVDPTNGYDYVDDYYDADNASAVTSVFDEIVANIAISAPQVPTEIKGTDPMTDGYITYTDPIGEYMEVKDVKAVIYAGQTFTAKSAATSGNTTTYTFTGAVHSPVYGDQEIKNIIITVTETDGKQTLVVKIPASVIPLRINEVTLNADGSVKTHTNNGAMPARVIYSVGLRSEITKEADDGSVYIDKSKISAEYLAANTNDDGTINFYSNEYTNPHLINGSTVGDTTVEFEPSHTNGFYYILEDMPIYEDPQFTKQVASIGNDPNNALADDTVYYYRDEHYHGNSIEVTAVERTGAQLKRTEIKIVDGYLYRATGSPRLNKILEFEGTKSLNATGTAQDFYAPEFHLAEDSTSAYDGKFIVHLGNNGLLTVVAGGNLRVEKTVNAGVGLTAPDKDFTFTLDINGTDVSGLEFNYTVMNGDQTVKTGTLSENSNTFTLKGGEIATIFSLPPGATYTVTEAAVAGFTTESEGAIGTISAGETSVASFTNTYNVTPVTYPTGDTLKATKVLERPGDVWTQDDVFTFFITPYNNAPLPEGYDANTGVTVNGPDDEGGKTATFDFGSIKFTAPGTYRYTIYEKEPENEAYLPGMSYSRALYRVVVTVVDNENGTLSIISSDIQKLYDDDANQLFSYNNNEIVMNQGQEDQDEIVFTNTYNAESVTRVPVALKDYTDNSGENPLVSGMFEFKLEALGVVDVQNDGNIEDDPLKSGTDSEVPMPNGQKGGSVVTKNEGHNITFPSVTFTQADIPEGATSVTFRYRMSEVIPTNRVNGMDYDDTEYVVNVVVSVDSQSSILNVSVIYPNDERIATFKNEYTPIPVYADINGNKTLNGRDMKDGEEFVFDLSANAQTSLAIRNGFVTVPQSTVAVEGATNGVASSFAFENIQFNKAGTYVFTVSESQENKLPAIVYDEGVVTVTVVVADADKDGELEIASTTYSNGKDFAEFTNTYSAEFDGTPISLNGTKTLTGKTLLAGEFYFEVDEYFNGTKINDGLVTHTADETGNNGVYTGEIVILNNVTYDKVGTYEYYITEQIPENLVGGTEYDRNEYRYTVVVEDKDYIGKLTVESTKLEIKDGNAWRELTGNDAIILFANEYTPNPTTATLPVINKVVQGDRSKALDGGEFKFELSEVSASVPDGMELPSTTVVSNDADGYVVFDSITFKKAGTYVVSVKEVIPADNEKVAGITYSTEEIVATFNVVDDRNGKLTATLVNYSGDTIINGYKAAPVDVVLGADGELTKELDGREMNENEFIFAVFDSENKEIATAKNTKDGKFKFTLNFTKADTYNYTIVEKDNGVAGITYDKNIYGVKIVVTDEGGYLEASSVDYTLENKAVDEVVFSNTYKAASADIALNATKKLMGRDLVDGEFKFVLLDEKGNVISTATNTKDGKIAFDSITFADAGTYKYTVYEEKGTSENVTYDKTEYVVEIKVTDDGKGKLVVGNPVIKKAGNSDEVAEIIFENTYTVPTPPAVPQLPQTGDNFNLGLWFALMFVSGVGLIGTSLYAKKKRAEER